MYDFDQFITSFESFFKATKIIPIMQNEFLKTNLIGLEKKYKKSKTKLLFTNLY